MLASRRVWLLHSERQCEIDLSDKLKKKRPKQPSKSLTSGGSHSQREIGDVRLGFGSSHSGEYCCVELSAVFVGVHGDQLECLNRHLSINPGSWGAAREEQFRLGCAILNLQTREFCTQG